MDKRVVELTLQGQRFVLKSDLDDETLNMIVNFANSRVDGIAAAAPGLPAHRIALLALLDMAEELFHEKRNMTDLKETIRSKSNLLLDMLEGSRCQQGAGGMIGDNPPGEG